MDTQFLTCLVAVTLITVTPGLDTMLIIRNTARGGWWDGAVSSLGICSGLFVHATVSALGISLLLLQTAWAFTALKFAGAGYLIWLGLASWRRCARAGVSFTILGRQQREQLDSRRSFREGFLSNVLNPKAVLFYMAFLPQFINPLEPPLRQSLEVAALHFTVAMLYQCALAAMVDRARRWLDHPACARLVDFLTGSVLIYLGSRIVSER